MFASVFLFFCCCWTAAVCGFETEIKKYDYNDDFRCIHYVRPEIAEGYDMNSNLETMHPPGSAQDSLSTTILAAYMDPVRCDVKKNKQETNHPIALDRNKLMDAIWIEPPSIRKSYECVRGLNR